MTPLEIMAKAAYNEWVSPVVCVEATWAELPESHRSRMIEYQRAALLALAEASLPDDVVKAGQVAISAEDAAVYWQGKASDAFRAMLRAIAEERGCVRKW